MLITVVSHKDLAGVTHNEPRRANYLNAFKLRLKDSNEAKRYREVVIEFGKMVEAVTATAFVYA